MRFCNAFEEGIVAGVEVAVCRGSGYLFVRVVLEDLLAV